MPMWVMWVKKAPNIRRTMVAFWRKLSRDWANRYRPELHYMRGPGPKWLEKHAQATPDAGRISPTAEPTAETDSVPLLI